MADAGPNYTVERRRLLLAKMEHEQSIQKGRARIEEIERQKKLNIARIELQNEELDDEVGRIKANEDSLKTTMTEIDKKLDLMVKETGDG